MSEPDYSSVTDETIPHEEEHAHATDAQMARTSDHAAVADVSALTPAATIDPVASASSSYVEAEADAAVAAINALITQGAATEAKVVTLVTKLNEVLDVLRDAELIPSS